MNKCWIFSLLVLVLLPGCIRKSPKIEDFTTCSTCQSSQCMCDTIQASTGSPNSVSECNDFFEEEVEKFDKRMAQLMNPNDSESNKVNDSTKELIAQVEVQNLDNNIFHDIQFGFGDDEQIMDDEQGRDALKQNIALAQKLLKESEKNDEDITFVIKVDFDNPELDPELSKRRADVVADHLVASGIPRAKIQIADASDDENFVRNQGETDSDEGGLNRSSEVKIVCS